MAHRRRRSFRIRVGLGVGLLVAAPLLLIGWRLVDVNRAALEDTTRERLYALVSDVAHTIDGTLDAADHELAAIGAILVRTDLGPDTRLDLMRAQVDSSSNLVAVAIYDQTGAQVGSLRRPTASGREETLPERLDEALRARAGAAPVALDTVAGPPGEVARVTMLRPLAGATATWFLLALVPVTATQQRVERLAQDAFGDDPEALFVVDSALRVVAHADPERAVDLPAAPREGLLASPPPIGTDEGVLVYGIRSTPRGRVVAATRQLGRTRWLVVAQMPYAHAFASIGEMRRAVGIAVVAALALALVLAAVWSGRLAAPVRKLVEFAGHLAHRRFDRRIALSTGDELEELATAMSGAAADLEASERRLAEERRIRGDLGRYLPARLVDQIVSRERTLALGGERRTVTVLFADVAAFTQLVEERAPEEVVTILNELFTIVTEIVFRHQGTVDKFIGDCVMAFWGAPDDQPDHAQRAVVAAEDMMRWLDIGNERWRAQHGVTIELAIGINTGEVVVGNFGSESRMEYTCIGDAVNVAARLEALARPQQILVTGATRAAAPAADYLAIGSHELPGRLGAIELFEVRP
jgi:class 3 adenylate cyclase